MLINYLMLYFDLIICTIKSLNYLKNQKID